MLLNSKLLQKVLFFQGDGVRNLFLLYYLCDLHFPMDESPRNW